MITCELTSHSDDTDFEYSIKCSGILLISEADELKQTLSQCLEKADSINIDFSETERIDTACIQLFMALAKSAEIKSKTLRYINIPEPISKAFEYLNVGQIFSRQIVNTAGGV